MFSTLITYFLHDYNFPPIFNFDRMELAPQHETLTQLRNEHEAESALSSEKWKQLEEDEQKLEEFKESLEKIEHEKGQINQDKVACRDKLEKGRKLLDELAGECESWKEKLGCVNDELENLLGDILIYAAIICILPAFDYEKRQQLNDFMIEELKSHEIPFTVPTEDDEFHMVDKTSLEQWRLSGLPTDPFFTQNAIAIQESSK